MAILWLCQKRAAGEHVADAKRSWSGIFLHDGSYVMGMLIP